MLVDYDDNEDSDVDESSAPQQPSSDAAPPPQSASSDAGKASVASAAVEEQHVKEEAGDDADWALPPRCTIKKDAEQLVDDEDYVVYGRVAHLLHVQASTGRHLGAEITRAAAYGDPRLFDKLLPSAWPTVSQHATMLHDAPDPDLLPRL